MKNRLPDGDQRGQGVTDDRQSDEDPDAEGGEAHRARIVHAMRIAQRREDANRPEVMGRILARAAHARREPGA